MQQSRQNQYPPSNSCQNRFLGAQVTRSIPGSLEIIVDVKLIEVELPYVLTSGTKMGKRAFVITKSQTQLNNVGGVHIISDYPVVPDRREFSEFVLVDISGTLHNTREFYVG